MVSIADCLESIKTIFDTQSENSSKQNRSLDVTLYRNNYHHRRWRVTPKFEAGSSLPSYYWSKGRRSR